MFRLLRAPLWACLMCACLLLVSLAAGAAAQQQGPIAPRPSAAGTPAEPPRAQEPMPAPAAAPSVPPSASQQGPALPPEEIIRKFAAREAEFKIERDNYTYTQTFSIQTLDSSGRVDGEHRMTSEIVFNPQGKRYERVTFAPAPTLQRISLSQQDLNDLENVQPFVLTTAELPKYNVKYVDRMPLDELDTYVFDVAPKQIEKNQRYFQGRIWVEAKDFAIVKTHGKAVPDIVGKKGESENVFPTFETFRENIEGNYWFPTYTRANDTLHFSDQDVRIRMTVRYANYKRFGVTVKIGAPTEKKDPQ